MKDEVLSVNYAGEKECDELSGVIAAVIKAIPYYNDTARHDESQKFTASTLTQKIKDDPYAVIIVYAGERMAGFCLSRFDDYTVWLEWFGVIPGLRGMGIANLLLNKLTETAAPRHCHKIWCDCRTSNKAAIHILTAHGYRQLVTIPNHWYGQDFILWEKLMEL